MNYAKKCPFCAEIVQQEAKICKHCGKDFKLEEKKKKDKVVKNIFVGFLLLVIFVGFYTMVNDINNDPKYQNLKTNEQVEAEIIIDRLKGDFNKQKLYSDMETIASRYNFKKGDYDLFQAILVANNNTHNIEEYKQIECLIGLDNPEYDLTNDLKTCLNILNKK